MSTNWVQDINEMHKHYGIHPVMEKMSAEQLTEFLKFRANFLQEELDELRAATNADDVVDALIDLCVVAIGTLDSYSVDSNTAWDRVLDANMKKKVGIKASRPNPLGLPDLIKPEGWEAPSHADNVGKLNEVFS
jgi:predicted HAD superfamily Cof-like phosphohydrolase